MEMERPLQGQTSTLQMTSRRSNTMRPGRSHTPTHKRHFPRVLTLTLPEVWGGVRSLGDLAASTEVPVKSGTSFVAENTRVVVA